MAPKQMQAVVATENKGIKVETVDVPKPSKGEILVKVHAAAQNPTDWKHVAGVSKPGDFIGCDFAGTVEEAASGIDSPAVGTRVAGFVHGSTRPGLGSFAQYLVTEPSLVWTIPEKTSFEEAAALGGVGQETAAFGLFTAAGLSTPFNKTQDRQTVLVWAGSTSVGQYSVQLAHQAGYEVVATSSPRNFDLVKKLGASAVFDYNDPEAAAKIKKQYPNITAGIDCISIDESFQAASSILKSGKLVTILPASGPPANPAVEFHTILLYTTRGKAFTLWKEFPPMPEDRAADEKWLKRVHELVADGRLTANKLKPLGGLEKVEEGFALMKENKISAEKIVYTIKH